MLVHASPRDPTTEYILPSDVRNPNKLERIFASVEHVCFVGHTHVPGLFTDDMTYSSPEDLGYRHTLDAARKTIVNVGSVGQPRDLDARACYVLFDGESVQWIRVEYDAMATARKIYAVKELNNRLGDRLLEGI